MKISLKDIIQLVLFTSIGGFILWKLWSAQEVAYIEECQIQNIAADQCNLFDRLIADFKSTNLIWLLVVCGIYMLSNIFRTLRWIQLLEPLGIRPKFANAFFSIMAGYFVNLGIPRSGEFARAGLLSKYEDSPFDKIMGTIIMDRTLDVVSLLVVLGLGFLFCFDILWTYLTQNLGSSSIDNIYFIGGILILLGLMGCGALVLIIKKGHLLKNPILIKIRDIILGLWNGMKSILEVKNIPLFVLYSIGIWLAYYLMTYWMTFAYEPTAHLSARDGLLMFDFGTLGIVFPSPGGMGTYHAMIMEALNILGVNKINGFAFAMILFFSINLFCNIAFGLIGLVALPLINRAK